MAPISDARRRANDKWNKENLNKRYDHIHLVIPAGGQEALKTLAASEGTSVNKLIINCIESRYPGTLPDPAEE